MHSLKKGLFLPILFLIAIVALTGCARDNSLPMQSASKFLTEFFTYNKDGRYDKLEAVIQGIDSNGDNITDLPNEVLRAYDNYYSALSKLATVECVDTMKRNRYPLKFEEQGSFLFKDLKLSLQNAVYIFTVELTYDDGTVKDLSGEVVLNSDNVVEKIIIN